MLINSEIYEGSISITLLVLKSLNLQMLTRLLVQATVSIASTRNISYLVTYLSFMRYSINPSTRSGGE